MKAILLTQTGNSEKLNYTEVSTPSPSSSQVLIKVAAAPVNFIDTIIREGNMPPGMMPELPFISGVEGSGTIVDSNGTNLRNGQKVAFLGPIGAATYAEYALVDADKLVVLDEATDLIAAGSMPVTYFTAYHMIHNVARVEPNKFALVYAASGGVGTALLQLLKLAGVKTIALERRDSKVEQALKMGADYAFNISAFNTSAASKDWLTEVKKITNNQGVNYIFNPVAGDTISQDLEALATLGHIVIFGFLAGVGETNMQAEVVKHFSKSPTISYSEIYATYFNNYDLVASSLEKVYALLAEQKIQPLYTTIPLAEAAKAHDLLENGKVLGKLVLTP
ncbi:quinone oxidoreductase family protein [Thalassotalea euphylliae]|uniref:Zinc-binding alcohol dehydrogenase family protein n=1 Tax=Thalassotalea euphylliae TaxID=1655234 RepID=A0A3E0UDA8_9GAMM|nr:zinc-binding dehydrogenase [Thalassotalea euphylliae]REL34978.1 zinc-binding alcohol dehydrogenase family protein [Thalassotalea euphylliae]